jgi:hypothetical protein
MCNGMSHVAYSYVVAVGRQSRWATASTTKLLWLSAQPTFFLSSGNEVVVGCASCIYIYRCTNSTFNELRSTLSIDTAPCRLRRGQSMVRCTTIYIAWRVLQLRSSCRKSAMHMQRTTVLSAMFPNVPFGTTCIIK